jgi:hypothetical protein
MTTYTTEGHRYPHMTLVDEEGVTVHYDLCDRCATVLTDEGVIDGVEMTCPEVDYDEGYRCDRCNLRISLS